MAWYNPIDWFTGLNQEIERGKELDAKISQLNQQKVIEGTMTQADYERFQQNNDWAETYQADADRAFWDGAAEGWDRMTAPVSNALDAGKQAVTTLVSLQFLLALAAIYLAYRYFTAKR